MTSYLDGIKLVICVAGSAYQDAGALFEISPGVPEGYLNYSGRWDAFFLAYSYNASDLSSERFVPFASDLFGGNDTESVVSLVAVTPNNTNEHFVYLLGNTDSSQLGSVSGCQTPNATCAWLAKYNVTAGLASRLFLLVYALSSSYYNQTARFVGSISDDYLLIVSTVGYTSSDTDILLTVVSTTDGSIYLDAAWEV